MNKSEFLSELRTRLKGLPQNEIEERLSFYGEAIDDRIEEGVPEEDAVLEIGSIDDIVAQIHTFLLDIHTTSLQHLICRMNFIHFIHQVLYSMHSSVKSFLIGSLVQIL